MGRPSLADEAVIQWSYAGSGNVRSLKLGDVAAVSHNPDASSQIGLEIQVGRSGHKRDHLATLVDEGELGSAGATGYNRSQDADGVVLTLSVGRR
jgi:hypothetical protein